MKKKKSEMSGLVLLLFSTLTLICGTTTSVKAQSSDNKKEIGVLKTLGKEDIMKILSSDVTGKDILKIILFMMIFWTSLDLL